MLRKQWSFFWAGVAFGAAQIIFMIGDLLHAMRSGGHVAIDPLRVTTGLGQMFRGLELFLFRGQTNLYGQVFKPDVWWPIVGMVLGGLLVGLAEKEFRSWVKYSPRMLLVSFIGGFLFSYGTRLAGGCTLHHLLGGIPLMQIDSFVVVLTMSLTGLLTFFLLTRLNIASNFKHQETLSYIHEARRMGLTSDIMNYDPDYRPWRDPWRLLGAAFALSLFGVAVYNGLFNPAYKNGLLNGGWLYVFLTLGAGTLAGFAMAKSGFGTECATVSVEASGLIKKDEGRFARLGVPAITRTLFRGLLPFIGVMTSIVITNLFIWLVWTLFNIPLGHHTAIKEQLNAGHLIGGALLGAGAVMLIGCEIRSYMRLGLLYSNTLVGFIGFAFGYLPYTLFYKAHEAFLKATIVLPGAYNWVELFSANPGLQKILGLFYSALLVLILVWALRTSSRNLGVPLAQIIGLNTEELQLSLLEKKGLPPETVSGLKPAGQPADD